LQLCEKYDIVIKNKKTSRRKNVMKKRLVAIIIACTMLGLAACGPGGGGAAGQTELSPDNPITIDILLESDQMAPNPGNKISALMEELLGVTINYEIVHPDQLDMRIGTLLAGGDFPDLIGQSDLEFRLIEGGALLRLDDMIDSGDFPNIQRHVEPFRAQMSYLGDAVEQGIYILPAFNRWYGELTGGTHWGTGFFLQKEVLSWAGYPDLSNWTLEQYFDLMEAYIAENPTDENGTPIQGFTFPVIGRAWGMTNPPMFLAGHPNNGGVIVDENNIARPYGTSEYAERYFRMVNEANARGLLDPETFTRTGDEYIAALAQGNILGMHDQRWAFSTAHDALVAEDRVNRTWVATMPTFDGAEPWYQDFPALNVNQGFGISVDAENPELMMRFLDTILSQEWQIYLHWGIEGEDFYVDADGRFYRSEEQRRNRDDLAWRAENRLEALVHQLPKIQGLFPDEGFGYGNAWSPADQPEEFFASLLPWAQQFLENYGKYTWLDFVNNPPPPNPPYYPAWSIALGDGTPAQLAGRLVEDLQVEWLPLIIRADPADFDDLWAQFVAAVDAVDQQPWIDAINEGIQQRVELWGGDSHAIN
jgi:putative aldouronate transport system substrate-binding protein